MRVRDVFIKHDQRREQWRVQPMGWIAAALVAIFVASSTSGVWRSLSGPRLRVTPTAPPTAVLVEPSNPTPRPTATSIVRGDCPEDPALWTLVPYTLPGAEEAVLYKVDPSCVMEQVERAFAACTDRKGERGRHWTAEDEEQCYSTAGYTTIIGGENFLALAPGRSAYGQCVETEKEDGTPVTSADLHFVFYTLGLVQPDSQEPLDIPRIRGRQIRPCDVRYALFHARTDGTQVVLTHFYLTTGEAFFSRFPQFQGQVVNKKLQIPLPGNFFD